MLRIINEPTAAAIAHGVADLEAERSIVVVDLGGGTLDVTLLETFSGVVEVTGTGGDGRLGGEDVTDALWAHACDRAGVRAPSDRPTPVQSLLRAACEEAKQALTSADIARLRLPLADGADWQDGPTILVTRADLVRLVHAPRSP